MSLRRKSCNACFKSRRKCDLQYPACATCRRTKKTCSYAYAPPNQDQGPGGEQSFGAVTATDWANVEPMMHNELLAWAEETTNHVGSQAFLGQTSSTFECSSTSSSDHDNITTRLFSSSEASYSPPSTPSPLSLVGPLGEPLPIEGSTETWQWVTNQLKSYPRDFAHQAQNVFIHSQLYREYMPRSIQAAFGISSTSCLVTDSNRRMLFRVVDNEVLGLLESTAEPTLLDELAKIQALLLYQMIRLFQGGIEQRAMAEQQQGLLMTWSLKLVRRCEAELRNGELVDWQTWILAECIRRTAIVVYMLYGINSIFREGICIGFPTLAKLPMSRSTTSWDSEEQYRRFSGVANVVPYEAFTALWLVSTDGRLGPFEKLLVAACRGLDTVMARHEPYSLSG
ncbi:Transcription factor gsfR2 [Paramyrothecium foliicola]|nr:Transcription factor gsfR2 [Paramyrothecium foliicola]